MSDRITLTGLRARGRHGVYDFERAQGQDFVVDVVLELDLAPAAAHRRRGRHRALRRAGRAGWSRWSTGEPVNLIETLADRLLAVCLADPRVGAATVTVHKPQAPDPARVHRRRGHPAPGRGTSMTRAVLSLGSNLGDRSATCDGRGRARRRACSRCPGSTRRRRGATPTSRAYLNAVVLVAATRRPTPARLAGAGPATLSRRPAGCATRSGGSARAPSTST